MQTAKLMRDELSEWSLPPTSGSGKISDDPRWLLAGRIASSGILGRSPLLSCFLLYVCDRYLQGRSSEITEQQIGVHVFGRREGYNSNDDNIVRNYARTLRKRIEEYFAADGRHEDLKLEIPRGAYVPVFYSRPGQIKSSGWEELQRFGGEPTPNSTATSKALVYAIDSSDKGEGASSFAAEPVEEHGPSLASVSASPAVALRLPGFYLFMTLGMAGILAIVLYFFGHTFPAAWAGGGASESRTSRTSHALWSQLFESGRDTFIIPADSGLVIMENLTRKPVSLADYISGNYHTGLPMPNKLDAHTIEDLGTRGYTSTVAVDFVAHLSQLKEIFPERMSIRHAHDLRIEDLRSGNAILLGSVDANPWVELFQQQLNFRFSYNPKDLDTSPTISSQHPLAGEKSTYSENDLMEPLHNTYGVVAYLPNLDGTGHVLLIQGINMAGTQAAGRFVLNSSLMRPVLERATSHNGVIQPFEILIETSNLAANGSRLRVVSERVAAVQPGSGS